MSEQLPKESRGKELTIKAETPEGKEIIFNLEQIREYWKKFYEDNNLKELADNLPETIELTEEQIKLLQEKTKEGFNYFLFLPSLELQQQYPKRIKEETEKPIPGFSPEEQYLEEIDPKTCQITDKGIWLSEAVRSNFLNNITTPNRPNRPYLLFIRDQQEVPQETLNKTADQLRQELQQKRETDLTLSEYILFQRDYVERHQKHPDQSYATWSLILRYLKLAARGELCGRIGVRWIA